MKYRATLAALAALAATACADGDDAAKDSGQVSFELEFRPTVNGATFSCEKQYRGIGMGDTAIRVLDFRLWLHDVELVRADGEKVPLALDESRPTQTIADRGAWQRDGVALLDFEDATGSCEGTPETNLKVVGSAAAHDDYVGLTFKVGVPKELNHLDATTAPYPFGMPGMAWQWKNGYRFVRIDVETEKFPKYYFHLGSSACDGELGSFDCAVENVAAIELADFNPSSSQIAVDLGSIYDELDVDVMGEQTNACMSGGTTNPLCPSMFGAFGLAYGEQPAGPQRFFRVEER
jgi:uncharacterized repeat protein (TIGR04052 family)